jgi:hypothetical protein
VILIFLTAALMMAHQVASKGVRDTLFLSSYSPSALPLMMIGAALLSIGVGFAATRLFSRLGTGRAVPAGFLLSGVLQIFWFSLAGNHAKTASIVVYLHMVGFSAVLLSSFWLLMSERFPPQEAKKYFGRIAGFGTLGGVFGGQMAAQWKDLFSLESILLALAGLHMVCGVLLWFTRSKGEGAPRAEEPWVFPHQAFKDAPYLRTLALLVPLGTAAAAILEILFKTGSREAIGPGPNLLTYLSNFNTATAVLAFVLQSLAAKPILERFGVAAGVSVLPVTVFFSSIGCGIWPGLASFSLARGSEFVVRGSIFRSAYEIFYTPVPQKEKRAVKTLIDVVFDRLGDAGGGLLVQLALFAGLTSTGSALPVFAAVIAAFGLATALRLKRGYAAVLERGLVDRAAQIDEHLSQYGDWSLETVLIEGPGPLPKAKELTKFPPGQEATATTATMTMDETSRRFLALRSGDPAKVKSTLQRMDAIDPVLAPVLIELLGWNEVWREARAALIRAGKRHLGQFADSLLDQSTDVAIRRRLPSVIGTCGGVEAAHALLAGMDDARFEVRLQCARALDHLVQAQPELAPPQGVVNGLIDRELSVTEAVWKSRQLLDENETPVFGSEFTLDQMLQERQDHGLEMLFSLLALIHPRSPLKTAFRALNSNDEMLNALSMEYVDGLLPQGPRERFRRLVKAEVATRPPRPTAEVEQILLTSMHPVVRPVAAPDSGQRE